jgi:hypothetical protein
MIQERQGQHERTLDPTWSALGARHIPSGESVHEPKARPAPSGLPPRYGAIALGSGLLMLGCAASVPLGPAANTAGRESLTVVASAAGLLLLLAACLPLSVPEAWPRWYARLRHLALGVAGLLTLGSLVTFAGGVHLMAQGPAQAYVTDIVSLTHTDTELFLSGRNPYTSDDAFQRALARFPFALGSPMRGRVFGTGYDQPIPSRVAAVQQQYAKAPQTAPDAFDPRTLHSYPALSFLIYVPLLWAGGNDILLLHVLVHWCLFAWLVWLTPVGWRHWGALVALAAMPTIAASLLISNEVIGIALVLTAWHFNRRPWLSAVLLGLACAYKQYTWFFVPFFALEILQQYGWREEVRRGAAVLGAFLLPNLPFLIASPSAWFMSLWLPMSDPLFAMGLGVIALSIGHLLPYAAPLFYALLELAVMGLALWACARWPQGVKDGALVLALVPLFFAFRSLADYFAFAPWLALYAVNRLYPRVAPWSPSRLAFVGSLPRRDAVALVGAPVGADATEQHVSVREQVGWRPTADLAQQRPPCRSIRRRRRRSVRPAPSVWRARWRLRRREDRRRREPVG